jgi:hypothetical protein
MFVGGVVVEDDMDQLASRDLALDGIEKADEFDVAVALHAAANYGAVEHAEGGEQRGGAVPLVIVRHGLAAPGVDRKSRLGAVECLDLALFVNRQHHCMSRRIEIEPDDVRELGGKAGIAGALEGAQPVRLQFVSAPDALHRTHRDADGFGHCPAGPVGRLMRRRGASQCHHPRRGFRCDRRLAGFAGLVAQQTLDPALGEALLPPPHRRPTDANALRHLLRRVPIRRGEHDARPLHMFARPVAVGHDRCQLLALCSAQNHAYLLCHGPHP